MIKKVLIILKESTKHGYFWLGAQYPLKSHVPESLGQYWYISIESVMLNSGILSKFLDMVVFID